MKNLESELLKFENDFNNLKKKIEKIHLIFILIYFSLISLIIIFFQKHFPDIYNIFSIKIFLFSLMVLGLLIHYFLRYKFYKNKHSYQDFFKNRIEEIHKNFSNKRNFNRSIVDYITKIIKDKESQISKNDLYKINFWGLLIKNLNIEPDKIIKNL